MNIEVLRSFLAVMNEKSISKAAVTLNISQSALSQQIKTMERDLGLPLLTRSNAGVTPTASGQIVSQYAQVLTDTYSNMLDDLEMMSSTHKKLRVCASPNIYTYALPCTIFHLKEKYPDFVLTMEQAPSLHSESLVLNDKADIGFIYGRPQSKKLRYRKIYCDEMCLVASYKAKLPELLTFQHLYRQPLLTFSAGYRTRELLDQYLSDIGVDLSRLNILYEMDSAESLKMSAGNGYGLAFIPYMAIKKELYNKQLKIVKLEHFQMINEYYAIRRKNPDQYTSLQEKLMNYLERILQDTIC
ncbi:LysR family transcriptional regulator [Bacilliculturomica massiliensis]|uniref:LysR family transcriptional regulator n=1 Tax=Bacilliculturomica massiliensis TaxID=1917867 RepID=UPI0010307FEC|nr:LysR family transcriptional regulator [Bacilliculturomica massiliensis]